MTVLNKIIQVLEDSKNAHELNGVLFPNESKLFNEVIEWLKHELPAEQQQIRDAWKASEAWSAAPGKEERRLIMKNRIPYPKDYLHIPDLETYIQSLN